MTIMQNTPAGSCLLHRPPSRADRRSRTDRNLTASWQRTDIKNPGHCLLATEWQRIGRGAKMKEGGNSAVPERGDMTFGIMQSMDDDYQPAGSCLLYRPPTRADRQSPADRNQVT